MEGSVVMAKVGSENGKATVTLTKEYVARTTSDVLILTIKEGALSQRALAEKVSQDLNGLGFKCSINESHFSQMINDPDHPLFKHIEMIASIAKHQNLDWLAHYFAEICGGRFRRLAPHEQEHQSE